MKFIFHSLDIHIPELILITHRFWDSPFLQVVHVEYSQCEQTSSRKVHSDPGTITAHRQDGEGVGKQEIG